VAGRWPEERQQGVLEHTSPVADAPTIALDRFARVALLGRAARSQGAEGRISGFVTAGSGGRVAGGNGGARRTSRERQSLARSTIVVLDLGDHSSGHS